MLLIVGLGNPGSDYENTRHNIGFMALDKIHNDPDYNFTPWKEHGKGIISTGNISGERVILLKPMTYMNSSGESIQEISSYYKIPAEDIFVIYDDMDLIPGRLKISTTSSSGGHNGIKSTLAHIDDNFVRVRIGIGHPGHRNLVVPYVLGDFGAELDDINGALHSLLKDRIDDLLNKRFNSILSRQ